MKRISLAALLTVLCSSALWAQDNTVEVNRNNSWLKAGLTIGAPVGDVSDYSSLTIGVDLKGQLMETPNWGLGITTGYNHYFGKEGVKDFGTVPLGGFVRYYPKSEGVFVGSDLGYSFVTGYEDAKGGLYVRPQVGYHNYNWNFFGFYNNVFRSDDHGGNIGSAGVGFTYNIRFNK